MTDTNINPDQRYSAMGSVLIEYRVLKRQIANPNIEAMLRILWEHFYDDMEGNPSDPDEAWEYNKEWSKIQMSGLPERLWTAALGSEEE